MGTDDTESLRNLAMETGEPIWTAKQKLVEWQPVVIIALAPDHPQDIIPRQVGMRVRVKLATESEFDFLVSCAGNSCGSNQAYKVHPTDSVKLFGIEGAYLCEHEFTTD